MHLLWAVVYVMPRVSSRGPGGLCKAASWQLLHMQFLSSNSRVKAGAALLLHNRAALASQLAGRPTQPSTPWPTSQIPLRLAQLWATRYGCKMQGRRDDAG